MHRRDAAQHKFDHGNRRFPISLISLGLAGSGTVCMKWEVWVCKMKLQGGKNERIGTVHI